MSQANQWTNWAFWWDLTGSAAAQPCIFISVFRVPVQLKRLLLSEGSKGATATFLGVYRPSYQYQAGEDSSGFYSKLNCVPLLLSIERRSAVLSAAASATPGYKQWGATSVQSLSWQSHWQSIHRKLSLFSYLFLYLDCRSGYPRRLFGLPLLLVFIVTLAEIGGVFNISE